MRKLGNIYRLFYNIYLIFSSVFPKVYFKISCKYTKYLIKELQNLSFKQQENKSIKSKFY